jgi:hypothetical protein
MLLQELRITFHPAPDMINRSYASPEALEARPLLEQKRPKFPDAILD